MNKLETPIRHSHAAAPAVRIKLDPTAPVRNQPYSDAPGYYHDGAIWLYGNVKLLQADLTHISLALGCTDDIDEAAMNQIERDAEELVLGGKVLVCGVHSPAHQRSAVVPLRWGAPRIVVFSGGFHHHLGEDLKQEPFRIARLWRYQWDPHTDLAISRRSPDRLPTYARYNPTVDRMIEFIASGRWPGLITGGTPLDNLLGKIA